MWHYRISGLSVASEIVLPGTLLHTAKDGRDVLVRRGSLPSRVGSAAPRPRWNPEDSSYYFEVPDLARFLVRDGREIVVDIDGGVDEQDVSIFVIGTAFGVLLHQRGHLVLHASAVAVEGTAVVFCGRSGAGKSTLAAALVNEGYGFVNDDTCHVGFNSEGRPVVFPDGRMLKLWSDAVENLSLADRKGAAVRSDLSKFYVPPACEADSRAHGLAAIYVLSAAPTSEPVRISKPGLPEAVALVRENAYRPRLVNVMNMEQRYFQDTARLLKHAGVFRLARPFAFSATPSAVGALEAHWRELGLIGAARRPRAAQWP